MQEGERVGGWEGGRAQEVKNMIHCNYIPDTMCQKCNIVYLKISQQPYKVEYYHISAERKIRFSGIK